MTAPISTEILRAELMRFSKEELVTELLGALLELAARTPPAPDLKVSPHPQTETTITIGG